MSRIPAQATRPDMPNGGHPRILHFGTGGGSGVTRFLVDLAAGHLARGRYEPLVVFRRKRKPVGDVFLRDLAAAGAAWRQVRAWPKFLVISELRALIREFRPQIVVAHGYSDHLWGRIAALRENVPVVVQVEHNLEHYKWLHLWRSRRLAARTDAIVTVSRGVAKRLEDCGIPADKLRPILNGVRTERFSAAGAEPWEKREPAVLMAARFARQKDHATLLHAVAELRRRGVVVPVRLAGGGSSGHQRTARRLAESLGLEGVVEFLGPRSDLPELYRKHRVAALSTRYEGLSLAVIEALVAGCAVVGSRVPGVEELIDGGRTGWLAAPQDPVALADAIQEALGPEGAVRAGAGRTAALAHYSLQRTIDEYEALFEELINRRRIAVTR